MSRYFATFVSGTQEIIGKRLSQFANADLTVDELHDGLALFESSLSVNQLTELRFFNNVFGLLGDLGTRKNIDDAARAAAQTDMSVLPAKAGFAIHTRMGSQTVGVKELTALQQSVADANGGMPDSFRPDVELLLWLRD